MARQREFNELVTSSNGDVQPAHSSSWRLLGLGEGPLRLSHRMLKSAEVAGRR